jgi:AraC-like DNA-binding protein
MPEIVADVLADVLAHYRVRGRVYCVSDLTAPWSLAIPKSSWAHFHVLERGGGWLIQPRRTPRAIAAGDLVIVTDGRGHVIADHPSARRAHAIPEEAPAPGAPHRLRAGGGGAETRLLCGGFEIADRGENPLLALLPPLMHLQSSRAGRWLAPLLDLLSQEARGNEAAKETVLSRLTEIIFVQALRAWVADQPESDGGWLGALRDRQIGRALALVHNAPEESWTIDALARAVGMSRTPFFARFRSMVGQPPLAYVTQWRMHVATRLLREGKGVAETASRVGYASEAAFSTAFKRAFGLAPAAYRRRSVENREAVS